MGKSSYQRGIPSRIMSSLLELLIQKIAYPLIWFSLRVLLKGPGKRLLRGRMQSRMRSRTQSRIRKEVESEMAEGLLRWLVRGMGWLCIIDEEFSKDITGFVGHYQFMSADKTVQVAVLFNGKKRSVIEGLIRDPDVTAVFSERKDLINYLMAVLREFRRGGDPPDALELILRHKVKVDGNVSYMMKFLYMANHVQLFVAGGLP